MENEPVSTIYDEDEWRAVWEGLDKPVRRQVQGALLRGSSLHDPKMAALAAGMAFRAKKPALGALVIYSGLTLISWIWIIVRELEKDVFPAWLQIVLAVLITLTTAALALLYRNLRLSQARNRHTVGVKRHSGFK